MKKGNSMSNGDTRYDRHVGPRDRGLRASDRDRDAVAGMLRREHVAGRLDSAEFNERLERCFAARTYADLDDLIADLPSDQGRSASLGWRWLAWPLLPLALLAAIVVGGGHLFWLAIPFFFFSFFIRPLAWRARGWGFCGPRFATRPGTRG
jgi:uncharacterized protein DUF1707